MNVRPSILCPVDYSEASASALRYASVVARHFVTRLIVLAVEDPLLTTALELDTGTRWTPEISERELRSFVAEVFSHDPPALALCEFDVAVGKPATEILRVARERSCDLIVIGSHGATGARRLFFGSTTERVLRETTVPVLVTRPATPAPADVENAGAFVRRIVVPVDLSPASLHQTRVASGLAEALHVPLLLVHVIEPLRSHLLARLHRPGLDASRRAQAEEALATLVETIPAPLHPESLIVFGDPAEEAARVVQARHAGLVVVGLHGSPLLGPRMGSVTYRLLCLANTPILALPPRIADAVDRPRIPAGLHYAIH